MPVLRTYRVFISHCWEYNDDYYTMVDWLCDEPRFRWKNLSVSGESPMREDRTFEKRLRKRLGAADIVLVIVGMEIAHRYWMSWEIKWARIRSIPIVGVMPNGAVRMPKVVEESGCPIVRWRRDSVISAIRHFAGGQR
ncbi:hypothetical protein PHYC_01903 [Phycisphaerales bacterium]|nr:hypothetical protein PHYC_01903 [Phycisphaerales bacterium]